MRSYNGGEFESNAFNHFCSGVGICRQLSVPYNPPQNEVLERKNIIVCEDEKYMLHDQDLYTYLWEESISTPVYIQNRSIHAILDEKTPEEVFTRENPYISHLCIFGFHVYVHIPKENRTKLDPSGNKEIFFV